jgi:hypothetical protein
MKINLDIEQWIALAINARQNEPKSQVTSARSESKPDAWNSIKAAEKYIQTSWQIT